MKISKLSIYGMFGEFNYELDFNRIEDNVTILTAPNGYGKSTILKIIDKFFNKKFDLLLDESFSYFEIIFDSKKFNVMKENDSLSITVTDQSNPFTEDFLINSFIINKHNFLENNKKFNYVINTHIPFMSKVKHDTWVDDRDGEILSTKELYYRYNHLFSDFNEDFNYDEKLLELIDDKVIFVETDRLSNFKRRKKNHHEYEMQETAIEKLSDDILKLLKETIKKQYDLSMDQSLDFPERVMSLLTDDTSVKSEDLIDKILKITEFDNELNENEIFGNLSLNHKIISQLKNKKVSNNKSFLLVLNSYLQDILERTQTCTDLANRIKLFKTSVNSLLQFKIIDIHPKNGLIVKNRKGSENGDFGIELLSSGEQHLIILLGNLIFNTKYGTLVLIDEPEISLHAAWQKRLLSLISEISLINQFEVLIATHSFTLINGSWDKTIELAEANINE